jgi:putative phosphoribosyl transferase
MNFEGRLQLVTPSGGAELTGELVVPPRARGLVLFSHGSGSSRFSPRNNFVAQQLQRAGLATYLFDLLTPREDRLFSNRFDISLLTERLIDVTVMLDKNERVQQLPIGYFGASTGAAAAIAAAVALPDVVKAIVSRGGRPDLAGNKLFLLAAPALFIVGGSDREVLNLNREAMEKIPDIKKLEVVPGATHLFEEKGTLERVAELSVAWFLQYLSDVTLHQEEQTLQQEDYE